MANRSMHWYIAREAAACSRIKPVRELASKVEGDKIVFLGMDWGFKDRSALQCPRCKTVHQWRKREPRRCRECSTPFRFTSNEV